MLDIEGKVFFGTVPKTDVVRNNGKDRRDVLKVTVSRSNLGTKNAF